MSAPGAVPPDPPARWWDALPRWRSRFGRVAIVVVLFLAPRWQDRTEGADDARPPRLARLSARDRPPVAFDHACDEGERITVLATGDALLHAPLQRRAERERDGWTSLWRMALPLVQAADVAYLNFEGVTSCCQDEHGVEHADPGRRYDGVVYSGSPGLNSHFSVAVDLRRTGFDVVSSANNHALDRGALGVDQTAPALEAAGLKVTGTRPGGDASRPWHTLTRSRGITIAWLSCTWSTNGPHDDASRILYCWKDRDEVLGQVRALAARTDVDAVFVTPHMGADDVPIPAASVVAFSDQVIEAGATAFLASHPHFLLPFERRVTRGGREALVAYSLGNFVSYQPRPETRVGMFLLIGLTRSATDGRVHLNGVRYVPTVLRRDRDVAIEPLPPGPSDALSLVHARLGAWNQDRPDTAANTTPQCTPGWAPEPLTTFQIGDDCMTDRDCADGLFCLTDAPLGMCTADCRSGCPQPSGRHPVACGDISGRSLCSWTCENKRDCRFGGWDCVDGVCVRP